MALSKFGETPTLIKSGEKFSIIALRGSKPIFDRPLSLGNGVEVWPSLPIEIPDFWDSYPGKHVAWHFESGATVFIVARRPSVSHDTDLESIALSREAERLHVGLYANMPGFYSIEGWIVEGYVADSVAYARQYHQLQAMYTAPGVPRAGSGIDPRHIRIANEIAGGLLQTHPAGDYHRLGRVNFALFSALSTPYMTTRLQQSVRVIEGLIFPPEDTATGGIFADRAQLFVGNQHYQLLRDLYAMRGRIEHLHGPTAAVLRVRPDAGKEKILPLLAYATFISENLAKACVTRLYTSPKLWPHFESDDALNRFWQSKGKSLMWGEKIDLKGIARSFDHSAAMGSISDADREARPGEEADQLARSWRGL